MLERSPDGSDRFRLVGTAPHPTADRPGADSDGRHLERGAGNFRKLHVDFESFCLIIHDSLLSMRLSEACRRRTSPALLASDRGLGIESRLLRSDEPEGGPVEPAVTTRDS